MTDDWWATPAGVQSVLREEIKIRDARIEELEAKIRTYEQHDGMDGAVVSAIRDLLNHHNVPLAAFIDDHVGNAIRQRNIAEAKLAKAVDFVLGTIRYAGNSGDDYLAEQARTTFAKLKGQGDD